MTTGKSLRGVLTLLTLAALLSPLPALASSSIFIVNINAPGVGFNDPTPVAPVGGNPGTTIGQQRLNAFQFAANVWGSILDSAVPIYIQSSFEPLACTATAATLGSAGALQVFSNFPGALEPATWYHVALANRLAFTDLAPGPNGTGADDIRARFNSNLGNAGCLTGIHWYYGFDDNHGTNIDLVTVLLHEFAHGLGFSTFVNKTTGANLAGLSDVYSRHIFDDTTGMRWIDMTDAQRAASTLRTRRVSWDGPAVTAAVPSTLAAGTPILRVTAPAAIAGAFSVGTAAFGPALSTPGLSGPLVLGLDPANAAGPSPTDGCSPLTNSVTGVIALLDRGTCGFTVKVKNAQNAGALGVIIADNVAGSPPAALGGTDPTIVIPSVRISLADGNALKAALASGPVALNLGVDLSLRAGADDSGRALLYTPNPVIAGSSISHWDTIATPNLLMEPNINGDLTHGVDLTLPLLRDVGWIADADLDGVPDDVDQCPHSNLAASVVIDACDSGVPNTLFATGCTISDSVAQCAASAGNHGGFVSCVAHLTNDLKTGGTISGSQKGAIQSCAAHAH